MIFTYNKEHVGDVLMVIVKNSGDAKLNVERKGKVARVFLKENGETVAGIFSKFQVYLKLQSAVKSF
ncbi:phenylalanyl-tRNA synthetase, beta subunit [Streptococcus pneumoniae]|nr:phenylalanyl-tRNA synthetase, beta subunit [Streptococcus pneumoniae]